MGKSQRIHRLQHQPGKNQVHPQDEHEWSVIASHKYLNIQSGILAFQASLERSQVIVLQSCPVFNLLYNIFIGLRFVFDVSDGLQSFLHNLSELSFRSSALKDVLINSCFLKKSKSAFRLFFFFTLYHPIHKLKCFLENLFYVVFYPC